ncbi:zinc finger HIT domain-containing protein 2 [Scleropages formosus]|uniref:Zinc finger, HIT-type containing 2 n=1 Tax=Scleropages formosus TaxID=113540 RepID=A0A8C9SD11_SCLFO|nr:zinc finger HIT domain-containing protein 2 [Scleropages formosus]
MNPVLRHRIPACVRSLLTDIEPQGAHQCWRDEDDEAEATPVTRDGIAIPGRGTSKPGEVLAPASEIQEGVSACGGPGMQGRVCGLCLSKPQQYTCPRCNVPYCSLACYSSPAHSGCSEEFYKESVFQELRSMAATEVEGRRQMQDILMRLRERGEKDEEGMENILRQLEEEGNGGVEQSQEALELLSRLAEIQSSGVEDQGEIEAVLAKLKEIGGDDVGDTAVGTDEDRGEGEEEDLAERLSGLDLDTLSEEQLWALLPKQDKEKFEAMIREGAIAGLVPLWRPWWETHDGANWARIEVLGDGQEGQREEVSMSKGNCTVREGETPGGQVLPKRRRKEKTSGGQKVKQEDKNEGVGGCSPQSFADKEQKGAEINVMEKSKTEEAAGHHERTPLFKQGHEKKCKPKKENVGRGLDSWAAVPPVSMKIRSLHSLSPSASPLVRYSLVNVLYGYAFSLRLFNGDLSEPHLIQDFCQVAVSVSESLGSNRVFGTLQEALEGGAAAIMASRCGGQGDPRAPTWTMEAVAHILTGKSRNDQTGFSLAALSQLRGALNKARGDLSREGEEGQTRHKYFLAAKKCEFLQAWVKENNLEVRALARTVWVELEEREREREALEKEEREVRNSLQKCGGLRKGPMVEEMD